MFVKIKYLQVCYKRKQLKKGAIPSLTCIDLSLFSTSNNNMQEVGVF